MAEAGYDALVVPRADEYLGEYIPAHNERLQWLSGFNGSAGVAIILRDRAAIFVDGRYTVQVRREVPAELFEYYHLIEEPQAQWLQRQLSAGAKVAFDPRMHSQQWYEQTRELLKHTGLELLVEENNLIDRCWSDRPAADIRPAILLAEKYTGESSASKRRRIGQLVASLAGSRTRCSRPSPSAEAASRPRERFRSRSSNRSSSSASVSDSPCATSSGRRRRNRISASSNPRWTRGAASRPMTRC